MRTPKESGFSLGVIVLIVLIAGVMAIAGWRIHETNKNNAHDQASNQSLNQNNPSKSQQDQSSKSDPNAGYVVIKEWGVRFKPVAGLTGIEYFKSVQTPNGVDRFDFSTAGLIKREPHCGEIGFSSVQRTSEPLTIYEKSLGKIGNYFYYYFGAAGACSQQSSNYALESQQRQLVQQSLISIEMSK
jgi:hypothetical protein